MVRSTAENLFDMHPPFQIDGNFGGVSGMTEMLLQSHLGEPDARIIDVLPALPDAWKNGSVRGLKARGNFTVDIEWSECKVTKLTVTAANDSILRVKVGEKLSALAVQMPAENGVFVKRMAAGELVSFA
jgi:alpha-L-fucosidase 2